MNPQHSKSSGTPSLASKRGIRGPLAALASLAFAAILAGSVFGCVDSRFAGCKTDDECSKADGGKPGTCYNLRCVECRYDTDCAEGSTCNSVNECENISGTAAKPDRTPDPFAPKPPLPENKPDAGAPSGDAGAKKP